MESEAASELDRYQTYREFVRRKSENQRLYRAKQKEERANSKDTKQTRKYRRRVAVHQPVELKQVQEVQEVISIADFDEEIIINSPAKKTKTEDFIIVHAETEDPEDDLDQYFVRTPGNNPPAIIVSQDYNTERVQEDVAITNDQQEEFVSAEEGHGEEETTIQLIAPPGDDPGHNIIQFKQIPELVFEEEKGQSLPTDPFIDPDLLHFELPIDEEQQAFFRKRDTVLRLMDLLDKDDRLTYLNQVEGILRAGVHNRIQRIRANNQQNQ